MPTRAPSQRESEGVNVEGGGEGGEQGEVKPRSDRQPEEPMATSYKEAGG